MRRIAVVAGLAIACSTDSKMMPDTGNPTPDSGIDASVPDDPLVLDPDIQTIVSSIDATKITASIQMLSSYPTRNSCGTGILAARDWILAQMKALPGMMTMLFPYVQASCTGSPMRDDVVAWIPGTKNPERLVIVGGHYDSRTVDGFDGTSPAPGANDSGSQTSVVLELARAFAGHTFDATVVFVAFAGEEQGLIGSTALANGIATVFPNADVVAMLNCDIVGGDNTVNDTQALQTFRLFSPGTPRETAPDTNGSPDDTSPSRGVMRAIGAWGAAYVPAMTMLPQYREDRPGRGGDHEPFIEDSHPGVRFIDPTESLDHQHTANDLFQFVTPTYTARVASVVGSVLASLARAPASPAGFSYDGAAFSWMPPKTGAPDHYVVGARKVTDNLYAKRVRIGSTGAVLSPTALGVSGEYYVSVAAVDAKGHESLFAYPELRCDADGCAAPPDALNITVTK
jgi:hypothetical protein